ncbi:hypothetical protein UF06_05840 [Vibrio sp. S234-5]|nr:hypothetical protein UF06_05840 [Vibrio sp. S234-5]
MRVNDSLNQEAWLYTFAEESLVKFAERVEEDIPESCMFIGVEKSVTSCCLDSPSDDTGSISESRTKNILQLEWATGPFLESVNSDFLSHEESERIKLGAFRERVIAAFDYV